MKESPPEFVLARGMPINTRLAAIAVLAVVGIAVQLLFSVFLGWIPVFAAVLLGAVRGKSNRPESIAVVKKWESTTIEELQDAQKLITGARKMRSDTGAFTPGTGVGCVVGGLLLLGVGFITIVLASIADRGIGPETIFEPVFRGGSLAFLFALDSVTLIAPLWMFGRVKPWEPPNIALRIQQLMSLYNTISTSPELEFQPSMEIAKTDDGSVPTDCKLMVKIKDCDPSFVGIQVQTSLNTVQSKVYPYTYCVLIGKPEFKLIDRAKSIIELPPPGGFDAGFFASDNEKKEAKFARFQEALVELKREGEVEIAVVRQNTKGTGYGTTPEQAMRVFSAAYKLAKQTLL